METSDENYPLLISSDEDDLLRNILTRKAIDTSQQTYDNINESFGSYPLLESSSAESGSETKAISNLSDNASFPLLTDSETEIREDNRELKQTDAAAANLQISIQKNSRPSEFSRPLTSITLNLNRDLPVDRRRVSLLKLPNDDILELSNSTDTNEDTCEDDEAEISSIFHHKKTKKKRNPGMLIFLYYF